MTYDLGFPFPPAYTPLYPSCDHTQASHHSFAAHFELNTYFRFKHSSEPAHRVGNASKGFWELSFSTSGPQEEIIPFNKTLA